MTYYMDYDIRIGNYRVQTLKSVTVKRSVEQLSDTATITLPGTLVNEALKVENQISRGDKVSIRLGYDEITRTSGEVEGGLQTEFEGYVKSINTNDTEIVIECEDELLLFDVPLADEQMKNISLKNLLRKIVNAVGTYSVDCDYDFTYGRFVFSHATALDVLKKIQDETKANIYFEGNTLHLHPQYGNGSWTGDSVTYDFAINVISSDLKYVKASDQKVEVEIVYKAPDGKEKKQNVGSSGGKKITRHVSSSDNGNIQQVAENEYNLWVYDGYEGGLTGWLIPYCKPGDRVTIKDASYAEKTGTYYVTATDVEFSSSGGRRKVTIGRKVN